tara:strand:+ start:5697 stop:5879 length:183 start_codon:yes stop_codon:yes gene_type:complete
MHMLLNTSAPADLIKDVTCHYRCLNCGTKWQERATQERPSSCPDCGRKTDADLVIWDEES